MVRVEVVGPPTSLEALTAAACGGTFGWGGKSFLLILVLRLV